MYQGENIMTKHKWPVWRGLVLIWTAILPLGFGCKQPSSPSTGGSTGIPGMAVITFTPVNESGRLLVTPAGPVSISKSGAANPVALTAAGDGFTGFTWVVDGSSVTGTETEYTLSGDGKTLTINVPALKLGGHSVTVYAAKDGVFWSPENPVTITVTK
jgi:hypothetical protein